MVKKLSKETKEAIANAISEAERKTSAELVVVVSPASDAYQSHFILHGLALGSVIAMSLWIAKTVIFFPFLLLIQLGAVALVSFLPWFCPACIRLVPKAIRQHRGSHRAYEEYMKISSHVSAATPIVLLYISVADRYAHIITSRSVSEKIPGQHWNHIISELTAAIPTKGLQTACIAAIQQATALITPHFPDQGENNRLHHTVIETK